MLSKAPKKLHLHLTLPASLKEVDRVLAETMNFLKKSSIIDNFFTYNYIIREGLNNAVIHGSHGDSSKTIIFDLRISRDTLDISIEDEGEGFDWKPLLQKQLVTPEKNHGRGIFCMSTLQFKTSYNPKGNILYLHKDLTKEQK